MNIYEKLSSITNELSSVAKNLEVGYGQNKYKATGEADVLRAIKPLEAKYKVFSYPFKREVIESGQIESTTLKGEIKKNLFLRIATTYRFVNMEKVDEYVDIISYGDGVDSQDKSVGKAMTYSDKYALMKCYKIITGDDPDQFASEDLTKSTISKKEIKSPDIQDLRKQLFAKEPIELSDKQMAWIKDKKGYKSTMEVTEEDKEWFMEEMRKAKANKQ